MRYLELLQGHSELVPQEQGRLAGAGGMKNGTDSDQEER